MNLPTPWTEQDDARLRDLWAGGDSCSEIGRLMRRNKNSVIGRAHRLQLPSRPSPIKRDGRAQPAPRLRAPRPRVPPRPMPAPPPVVVVRKVSTPGNGCRWPMWSHTERATQVFCDAARDVGRPYCPQHHAIGTRPLPAKDAA